MKYNVNIHSANPLYFIIDKIDTLKKKNGNKYLVFASTGKNRSINKIHRILE